ncbi:MAG: L,D-transpeptidase family protein, partial [Clostridiales bacterium]|uniref:L,D-transpeptidase family protein n=1 Tax=Terrisporobacter sp. TaxID=1965305 RepID=UPI002A4F74ED
MKKRIKSFCAALLAIIIIFSSSATISDAASKQLIIINSKYNTLNFYENNILVKKFKCATGKASTPTPQRKTTIVNKIKNRPYYKLGIPGGDPRNPLGKRWMGLNMYGYGTTYGIHGTNNESSIGKNVSGGCIRMYNKDVEWLFNRIRVGATVIIKSTSNSDEWIAKQYGIKLKKTWYTQNGYKYYRKSNGKNAVGWNTIDGKTYYFDSKGRMQTGLKTISGNKYYLGTDGVRRTGWQTINGSKYYFKKTGSNKGQALKGKRKISGNYYYFDSNYKMVKNKLVKDYYYGKDGKLVKNKKVSYKNDYYYVGSNGKIVKNKEINNSYYGENGKAYKSCEKVINGIIYTFDEKVNIVSKVSENEKTPEEQPIK